MKNNKGMTLVEIIISIVLISIVLLFLFALLVTVNDINTESEVNSSYLINKSLILKNIEEDLSKAKSIKLSKCEVSNFYTSYNTLSLTNDDYKISQCIALRYKYTPGTLNVDSEGWEIDDSGAPKYAYVGLYYYSNKSSYVISYIHGNIKATRLLDKYEKYNVNDGKLDDNFKININLGSGNTCDACTYDKNVNDCNSSLNCSSQTEDKFSTITIPIIGPDEKDYSIIISYYGKVTIE